MSFVWLCFVFLLEELYISSFILKKRKKKLTTALICALLFHFLEVQCTVFKINRSSSLESFAMYLKTQEVSDILLSSSYDGVVAYHPVHPLDFSRASIGYSKAVEPLIVI